MIMQALINSSACTLDCTLIFGEKRNWTLLCATDFREPYLCLHWRRNYLLWTSTIGWMKLRMWVLTCILARTHFINVLLEVTAHRMDACRQPPMPIHAYNPLPFNTHNCIPFIPPQTRSFIPPQTRSFIPPQTHVLLWTLHTPSNTCTPMDPSYPLKHTLSYPLKHSIHTHIEFSSQVSSYPGSDRLWRWEPTGQTRHCRNVRSREKPQTDKVSSHRSSQCGEHLQCYYWDDNELIGGLSSR